jgi:hypothetical protein
MNQKDEEAFDKWVESEDKYDGVFSNNNNFTRDYWIAEKTWEAACEYMQAELAHHIFIIEAENKKLREALEFYAEIGHWGVHTPDGNTSIDPCDYENMIGGKKAREALKKVEE